MKKYAEYKDSGVEWIGEIPKEWDVKKLGKVSKISTGNTPSKNGNENYYSDTGLLWVKPDNLNGFIPIEETKEYLIEDGKQLARVAPPFTPLVCCIGTIGKFGYSTIECAYNQQINAVIFDEQKVNWKFGLYALSSQEEQHWYYSNGNVMRILNTENQKRISITLPDLTTQQAIADYLDRKTTVIDTLIADKQKLIDLLREKRQTTINEAVTKGLDKTVKMKDSGIDWIGEIPAHWDILSNHQLFVERNQKNTDANVELLSVTKYLGVILQSRAQELRLATIAPADSTEGYKIVKKGDLVMNIMRAKDGSYGISTYDGVISPAYCIYQARKKCNPQFLFYLFKTQKYVQIFKCYSTGIAEHRMRLYPEDFNQIPAILPPIAEQDEIAKKLDAESKRIDEVIALTEQQIEKLKEYRLSIISEVVTGKVVV